MEKICVLGLGYVGLPTASMLATHGYKVIGVDAEKEILKNLKKGNIHIKEPGLETIVAAATQSKNLIIKDKPETADVFIIAVPTPIDKNKKCDLSFVKSAARQIIPHLRKGNLVILESTVPPGTTTNVLIPLLKKSKLKIGEELFVAYCPERVLPGRILKELALNNRIIGGINQKSAELAREIYSSFVEGEITLTNATTAEAVKLMENVYRDVNIALVNELAMIADKIGVNAWEVIRLANKHPRVNLHKPGPGVGGHCIAVDPWFMVEKVPNIAKLISLSRRRNDEMPQYVLKIIRSATRKIEKPRIAILGLAYKANIDDIRESPALKVAELLKKGNFNLVFSDPHVKTNKFPIVGLKQAIKQSDCLAILTDHDEYKKMNPHEVAKVMRHRIVIDLRNCLDQKKWSETGFKVFLLGQRENL